MQEHPNLSHSLIVPGQFSSHTQVLAQTEFCYILAPLEANTDVACRNLCYQYGADVTITEMVRVKSANSKNKSTWNRLNFYHDSTPVIVQLLTSQEKEIEYFLQHFIPPKNFYGFNLNLSCPSTDIVQTGLGCALVKRPTKVQKMIDVVRQFQYPISVKIRLGMNALEKQNKVYCKLIQNTTPDFFIVHARHGGQKYIEPADFSIYQECVEFGKPIIANGDIHSIEQINALRKIGLKGVMLGRSALANPALFCKLKNCTPRVQGLEDTLPAMRKKYLENVIQYSTHEEYQKNFLRRLGQDPWLLDRSTLR